MPDRPPALHKRGLVKICGLTDERGMAACIEAGADLVGLVFVEASPRHVTLHEAGDLARLAAGGPGVVGLFQNASRERIEAVTAHVPLDLIQLHGAEDAQTASQIADATGLPVIKALGVGDADDLRRAASFETDMLILDAAPPRGAGAGGGHGTRFDWALLEDAPPTPWLLAGGLDPENVATAVLAAADAPGFSGVDVSSGVEARKGLKDPDRIARFVAAAKAAMARL